MYLVQYSTCPDLCIFLTLQLANHELFSQHDSSTALGHFTDIPWVILSEDCQYLKEKQETLQCVYVFSFEY